MLVFIVVPVVVSVMALFFLVLCTFGIWWWHACSVEAKHDVMREWDYMPNSRLLRAEMRLAIFKQARRYFWGFFPAMSGMFLKATRQALAEKDVDAYAANLKRQRETS